MSASTEKKNRQAAREAGTDKKILAAQEEAKKKAKSQRRWTLGTVGVILLIALILFLNSGLLYKTTAYSVGDTDYTAAQVNYSYATQYYYMVNQYGSYASMLGIDTSTGLAGLKDSPCSMTDGGTWRDYFLDSAKSELLQTTALVDYANANGVTLTQEEVTAAESGLDGMDEYAKAQGFASVDNMFSANYGEGVNSRLVIEATKASTLASKAYSQKADSLDYTQEQLKEKYASYNGDKDSFAYLYYYVAAETVETPAAEGQEATSAVTEETLAAAKATAQAIERAYNAAEGEDYLARFNAAIAETVPDAAATEQKAVSGSSLGDYKDWMMSSGRQEGQLGLTESSSGSGYYLTVYLSRSDNAYPMAQVRHILIKAVADADGNYTDEAKAEAKTKAQDILKEWKAGDKTEDSFAALAEQYSEDTGSNTNGGLYDSIYKGQTVEEFDAFCFDSHKPGDTAVVYGESGSYAGYHVMYYVGEGENYCDYLAKSDLSAADIQAWLTELQDSYATSEGFGMRLVG